MTSPRSDPTLQSLPLLHQPYRLPRPARSGRVVAPSPPFTDNAAVLAVARQFGGVRSGPEPHLLAVDCLPGSIGQLAARLADTGVAGLRVIIRVAGPPEADVAPSAVRDLAAAGVSTLEITAPLDADDGRIVDWIELNKAALAYGLPLAWTGPAPTAWRYAVEHLVPARDDAIWRQRWRYAALTWRRGPGYALIEDRREIEARRTMLIDLPALTAVFGELLDRPAHTGTVGSTLLAELTEADLVAVVGVRAVWLPYRLVRPPVNFVSA